MGEDSRTSTRSASRVDPPALASDYLRSFAGALRKVHAFDDFFEALGQVVGEDTYLAGSAELSDYFKSPATEPEFEDLDDSETVVSVTGAAGNAGYLRYRGRRDGEPFGAEDLHLMGAIAGFIAVVTAQADRFRRQGESTRVFQYLINQLPLGVVCYKADGELLIENKVAARLLGDEGALLLKGILNEAELAKKGRIRLHIEAEEKLLFVEGRRLKVDDTLSVTAFVLHDMSGQREKLLLQLERAAFRAESRGSALTVALLEDRSEAGRLYRLLKESAEVIEHSSGVVQSLDAFTCACVFEEKRLRSVRYLLRNTLPAAIREGVDVRAAFVSRWQRDATGSPAESILQEARSHLSALDAALCPGILVMDPYQGVVEALRVIASDVASFHPEENPDAASAAILSGEFDGIFLDVDSYSEEVVRSIGAACKEAGSGFRVYYVSHMQPSMVYAKFRFGDDAIVFQKPFDAERLRESLALQFNFA